MAALLQMGFERYAIVCFSPDEVDGIDRDDLEAHLVNEDNEHISHISTQPPRIARWAEWTSFRATQK